MKSVMITKTAELVIQDGKIFCRDVFKDIVNVTEGKVDHENKKVTFRWSASSQSEYSFTMLSVILRENIENMLV